MKPIAVITEAPVVEKILDHVGIPLEPVVLDDGAIVVDVTDLSSSVWDSGPVDLMELMDRGPPAGWDGVDPPATWE